MAGGKPASQYNPERLKQLEMTNAKKDQTIKAYNVELNKLQEELTKLQIAYSADKEIHASFIKTMHETDLKFKAEIDSLKRENETLRTSENELREQCEALNAEMALV